MTLKVLRNKRITVTCHIVKDVNSYSSSSLNAQSRHFKCKTVSPHFCSHAPNAIEDETTTMMGIKRKATWIFITAFTSERKVFLFIILSFKKKRQPFAVRHQAGAKQHTLKHYLFFWLLRKIRAASCTISEISRCEDIACANAVERLAMAVWFFPVVR